MSRRQVLYAAIVVVCVGLPCVIEWATTPPAQSRSIHMEAYRYGTTPSIIRVNRGDDLTFTFSSKDTGHSFLLQDYRVEAKISPVNDTVAVFDPLRLTDPPKEQKELKIEAGRPGWWGNLTSLSRFRCHVYCGLMHGFEQGDLIVRPNWLFTGGMGMLVALVLIAILRTRSEPAIQVEFQPPSDLNRRFRILDWILKQRPIQFMCSLPALAGFVIIIVAGLFGTKVGGRNIAVMLTWAFWMSLLTLVVTPLAARLWCLVCPLPILGEYLQRRAITQVRSAQKQGLYGNRFFGLGLQWPRTLHGTWLRVLCFLSLGTFSASLAGQPKWTAITIFSLMALALLMSLVWELRAFCRYVCPVASFISCYSPIGRFMVRSRDQGVCRACTTKACRFGNDKGWGCPFGLAVPAISRNTDCGFCTECFKSCPYNNVMLGWRKGTWTDQFPTYGEAWQAIVLLVLAMTYSLTVHAPWPFMRDLANVVDKATWPQFLLYAAVLWGIALGVAPLLFWSATSLGARISSSSPKVNIGEIETGDLFKKTMPSLIPIALALWAAFFIDTIMVNFTFILYTFSDPFGWNWDLFGTAGMPWVQIWPSGLPWIHVGLVLTGLAFSFKKGIQLWMDCRRDNRAALRGFAPTAVLLAVIAAGMLIYFADF